MNKEEILIAIKEIQCRYSLPALEMNFTDKDYACKQYEKLIIHLTKQQEEKDKEIERLKRQIRIKDEWCDRIWEIGTDYDGYGNNLEELKKLIDELIEYSNKAKKCDDKSVAYIGYKNGIKTEENILMERIGVDKE